jgi:hypothetical protein
MPSTTLYVDLFPVAACILLHAVGAQKTQLMEMRQDGRRHQPTDDTLIRAVQRWSCHVGMLQIGDREQTTIENDGGNFTWKEPKSRTSFIQIPYRRQPDCHL